MATLRSIFIYLFWPNPGNAAYDDSKVLALLVLCVALILGSFILHALRRNSPNPVFKKLSRSWSSAAFWFGVVGLVLVVSRVEGVGFLAMRAMWVFWGIAALLILWVQVRIFRSRYYQPLPREESSDPRDRYLPRKKK